jgi:excisionase family DNA binding protein
MTISLISDEMIFNSSKLFDNLVWMTSEEAAKYLRKTVGALRTAVNRGQIRARRWRRRLYFKKIELDLLLEDSR